MRPIGDNILVRLVPVEKTSPGGIALPDMVEDHQRHYREGVVVTLGVGRVLEDGTHAPFEVALGDKVFVSHYMGTDVDVGGIAHILVREEDVLCAVEE